MVHPIRASLAMAVVGATIFYNAMGIPIAGEWWVLVGAIVAFYFAEK